MGRVKVERPGGGGVKIEDLLLFRGLEWTQRMIWVTSQQISFTLPDKNRTALILTSIPWANAGFYVYHDGVVELIAATQHISAVAEPRSNGEVLITIKAGNDGVSDGVDASYSYAWLDI